MKINEVEVDKLVEESKNCMTKSPEDILNEKKKIPVKKNEIPKDEVNLAGLGNYKKVTKEEADIVFAHLPTTVFQIHKCLFRISFIEDGKYNFTAELLNLEETPK